VEVAKDLTGPSPRQLVIFNIDHAIDQCRAIAPRPLDITRGPAWKIVNDFGLELGDLIQIKDIDIGALADL
jgi:hypothetical protein